MSEINHSIWLIPEKIARERFAAVMAELAHRHGGPVFDPHVTLYGGMRSARSSDEMLSSVEALAASMRPVRFEPTGFGHSGALYRCAYVEAAGSAELIKAHDLAAHVLFLFKGRFEGKAYLPHVSLMYAEIGGAEREAIVAGLDAALLAPFTCDALELWDTTGAASHWRRLGSFSMQ